MWHIKRQRKVKNNSGKNTIWYVYDIRTTMTDFCASFAVRQHANDWGLMMFGEHAYVSDRRLHMNDSIWNGRIDK
jgi:hypothetical protein